MVSKTLEYRTLEYRTLESPFGERLIAECPRLVKPAKGNELSNMVERDQLSARW
jgi:hypothetical protein